MEQLHKQSGGQASDNSEHIYFLYISIYFYIFTEFCFLSCCLIFKHVIRQKDLLFILIQLNTTLCHDQLMGNMTTFNIIVIHFHIILKDAFLGVSRMSSISHISLKKNVIRYFNLNVV